MQQNKLIIVVDDELIIAEHLASILKKNGFDVLSFFSSDLDFEEILTSRKPVLVFLDIHLELEISGLDLAAICKKRNIPFIFLTSYSDEKTVQKAIDYGPLAYILKPFTVRDIEVNLALANAQNSVAKTNSFLLVKDGYDTVKIDLSDIKWLKSHNNYTEIVTNTKKILQRKSLQETHELLPQDIFLRVHRSYVVNVNFITKVTSSNLVLGPDLVPLSRSKKEEVIKIIST